MFRNDVNKPDRPVELGVTVSVPEKYCPGYTLCYSRSREAAFLVSMEGHVVHRWQYAQGIPWHFAEMLPNGHLLDPLLKEGEHGAESDAIGCAP